MASKTSQLSDEYILMSIRLKSETPGSLKEMKVSLFCAKYHRVQPDGILMALKNRPKETISKWNLCGFGSQTSTK